MKKLDQPLRLRPLNKTEKQLVARLRRKLRRAGYTVEHHSRAACNPSIRQRHYDKRSTPCLCTGTTEATKVRFSHQSLVGQPNRLGLARLVPNPELQEETFSDRSKSARYGGAQGRPGVG